MSLAVRFAMEPVRSLAFGSIGAAYAGVGTVVTAPLRAIIIENLTDASVMFSWDGIDDHFPLPVNGALILDITANKSIEQRFELPEGGRLYVKQLSGAPTTGSVYFSTIYGAQ